MKTEKDLWTWRERKPNHHHLLSVSLCSFWKLPHSLLWLWNIKIALVKKKKIKGVGGEVEHVLFVYNFNTFMLYCLLFRNNSFVGFISIVFLVKKKKNIFFLKLKCWSFWSDETISSKQKHYQVSDRLVYLCSFSDVLMYLCTGDTRQRTEDNMSEI